jgi:hypothetical protein
LIADPAKNSLLHTLPANTFPSDARLYRSSDEIKQTFLIQTQSRRGPPILV